MRSPQSSRTPPWIVIGLGLLFARPFALRAEGVTPISTDRPDQTDSTDTTPARLFQVETGWQRSRDSAGREQLQRDAAFGTLMRYGLAARFELRLSWIGEVAATTGDSTTHGTGDGALGIKWRLRDAEGARPAVALEARTSLPVGAGDLSTRRADPALLLVAQHTLSDRLSLGWNAGLAWNTQPNDAGERQTLSRVLASASLGIALNDRWSGFFELFGDTAGNAPGASTASVDAGLLWLWTPRLQLDLNLGQALSRAAPDSFFGFGLSFRVPA